MKKINRERKKKDKGRGGREVGAQIRIEREEGEVKVMGKVKGEGREEGQVRGR